MLRFSFKQVALQWIRNECGNALERLMIHSPQLFIIQVVAAKIFLKAINGFSTNFEIYRTA